MQRAAPGSSDGDTNLRNDLHHLPQPPSSSFTSSVTASAPAKRITFFRSGDTQFKGVRMAIHKRSFKCFDALLDDLSQKVPLPFGVRTITTPRGTHSIKHLEQLEDGGCYLCSDRRYVKPINMEAAGKRPAVWHHHIHPNNTRRKPSRPEESPSAQHYHRHPKRIVLVKNNDPAVRRSIILSRRTARSLRVFIDEISELMQCHVKKLYTLEGRKIDSIQSLMQCPGVLVCVGREPFRPLLMESLKKLSDERLPGMGARSRSSICSESHESKKNVNFGLETKKSIIHPRSDSSNRSTRFSLSSEKSYQNGLCMTPGQSGCISTGPYMKEVVLNDDIEKRVLVNKDGSLSVEMKVRFRLCNDETLQWSTEIKKSSLKLNDSSSAKDSNYLKAKAEYSDPDSNSPSEAEEAFVTKLHQKNLEESHCQNCCNHCQEYDIWKNPMHRDQGACKSPSSGGSSHKIVHKSSVDSMRTVSRSSEEYTEHVVEKASCFQQTMEEGDTRVEYCTIRRCCSRSEVSATKSTSRRSCEDSCESHGKSKCSHMHIKEPDDTISPTPHYEVIKVSEDRPVSAVSNSSKVLESLKEDQDDEYDDLPPSVSRASDWSQSDNFEGDDQSKCCCCSSQASPRSHLSPRPPSKVSSCAVHSLKLKKYKTSFTSPVEPDGLVIHTDNNRAKSTSSTSSKVSSRLHTYNCEAKTPISVASSEQHRHSHTHTPVSNAPDILQICEDEKVRENGSLSAMSANTGLSKRSGESNECRCCGECKMEKVPQKAKEDVDSISNISFASEKSASKAQENFETVNSKTSEEDPTQERSETALSENSNTSLASKHSKKSNRTTHKRCSVGRSPETDIAEERFKSAMSVKSNASAKSSKSNQDCIISERVPTPASSLLTKGKADENIQERAASPMSGHSNISARSRTSNKSRSAHSDRSRTPRSCLDNLEEVPLKLLNSQSDKSESAATQKYTTSDNLCGQDTELNQEVRSASAMSFNKSNQSSEHPSHTSEETKKSVRSCCQLIETKATQESSASEIQCEQETEITPEERLGSSLSHCSKTSLKSNESSHVKKKPSGGIVSVTEYYPEERVASAMSGKTHTSCGSCRSHKSNHNIPETTVTSAPNAENPDECATPEIVEMKRTTSAMSQRSAASVKSKASSVKSIKSGPKTPETSDPMEHGKDMTQNVLNVTSPLPRSKRSPSPGRLKSNHNTEIKDTNSRASSGMSGNSKISSHSKRSSKCHCHSSLNGNLRESKSRTQKEEVKDETEERVVSSLSGKSKLSAKSQMNNVQSLCNQLEEPLSPTSTASVSLGLGEEFKCDDFDEQSISGMSATTEDDRKKLELENGVDVEGRPKTATSVNSEKSKKSHHINCKTPVQAPSPVSVSHAESVMSAELNKKSNSGSQLNEDNIRVPSALSVSSSCSKSIQGSVKNTATKGNERASETVNDTNHAEKTETDNKSNISGTSSKLDQNERASGKVTPASDCLNSTKISEHSVKSKKDQSTTDRDKRSKCSSRCLEINKMKCDRDNEQGSVKSLKSSKSDMRSVIKEASRPNSEVMSDISQNCKHLTKEMAKNSNKASAFHSESSRDSVLSRALSAADLLREIIGNARPVSRGSKSNASGHKVSEKEKVTDNESKKSSRRKDRKISNSSEHYNDKMCSELMPSCLPNASPTEVVNDWLRNIPIDGLVYEMDIELNEELNKHFTQTQGDEDTSQMDKSEAPENIIEAKPSQVEEPKESGGEEHVQEENNCSCDEKKAFDERVPNETSEMDPKPQTLTQKEGLPKRCHSSVQVMKVLLGPKLDRCSSLPEVSPIYGRKLSQSAQGLLDCLAKLRLIDSDSKNEKDAKYNEIMMILKSLWLHEPSEDEQNTQNMKEHHSGEDEFNPRSSSGVDLSSGSAGSVKGSVSGLAEKSETTQGKTAPVVEHEPSLQDQDEAVVAEDEQKSTAASCEDLNPSKVPSDPITLDIAEEVHDSPENKEPDVNQEKTTLPPATEEYIQSAENNNESVQTPPTSSNKSSGNESSTIKSLENTSSGTPPSVQRAPLTKRISQDPDPIWVLSLLKKIEKQFMLHYADAMAEFKVRWDLDDNEMLNAMITELKEEIHKRIQSSITRELQKIQSRAGRGPRPPGNALSRDSTVQTEQRRKRLRVMRNKSISLSRSEDNYTASGTEFSDQRSEDEYCPCDACMKKKMASKGVQRAQALSLAPVMMEFDLRKILQKKKDPAIPTELKTEEQNKSPTGNNENNLEVVHEEADEVNGEHANEDEDQDVEKEEDGIAKTETEAINMDIVQEVSAVSEIKDSDEEKTNGKEQSEEDEEKAVTAEEEEETEEGEDGDGEVEKKEEIVVDGTADTEEKKEVEIDGEAVQGEEEEEAEKEATEGDTAEDSEEVQDGEKGERAGDEKKENMEAAEITETEEETESRKEETVPEVEAAETEKREDINDERLEDNKPAEDGCESEFNKEDISVTAEGETPDESETPNEGQKESAKEMNADENQGEPAEDEAEEDKTSDAETDGEQPEENVQSQNDKEDPENETETETTGEIGGVDSEHSLAKQETRTSVESQPGSSENSNDHTGQAKLKDLHSFMESAESQGENMVVITKQPPYKESSGSHRLANTKDIVNDVIKWELTPKRHNRSQMRTNK